MLIQRGRRQSIRRRPLTTSAYNNNVITMPTSRPTTLAYTILFLGIYVVPLALMTLFGVHGQTMLIVLHGATVVQIVMILYFVHRKDRMAMKVGTIVTALIVLLNMAGAWFPGK